MKLHVIPVIVFFCIAILPGVSRADIPGPGLASPISLDDLESISEPSTPRISSDGKNIAFVHRKQVHVASIAGDDARPITSSASTASDPYWSTDGQHLYFLSDRSGTFQLWQLPVDKFGEAKQLTELEPGIESLSISPDESRLLLILKDKQAPAENTTEKTVPWVIDRLEFKKDEGDGYITDDESSQLHVYDIKSRSLRQITSGPYKVAGPSWSADGKHVVFASNRQADPDIDYSTDLWLVDVDNIDQGRNLKRLTQGSHTRQAPAFSPDGRHVAFIDAEDGVYGIQHLAIVPVNGSEPRVLTRELDRWVVAFRFSADGKWIYLLYENGGGRHLARVRPGDGRLERLVEGERFIAEMDVDSKGNVAALVAEKNEAADVFIIRNQQPRRLTRLHADFFQQRKTGSKVKTSFKSADGTVVEAFVTRPPGFMPGKRYPTVLNLHGGPVDQFTWRYDFESQYLAARGYVVVEPNPRGSTGRGQDYIRAIYQTWGITDYDDVMAAIDHVIDQGIADPERLAVFGYSYGGFMVDMIITRTNRFKAAAAGAGQSLIIANYGHDIYQKWYHWEFGLPWENREAYERVSPFNHVDKVQTPTLILGGRNDWNVTILNSEVFYQALRKRGIDTQLVVYPQTHHGDWQPAFQKDYLKRVADWFDKYL